MNVQAECRFCGSSVRFFGEICEDCRDDMTPEDRRDHDEISAAYDESNQ